MAQPEKNSKCHLAQFFHVLTVFRVIYVYFYLYIYSYFDEARSNTQEAAKGIRIYFTLARAI